MIPSISNELPIDIQIEKQPTKTYRMDIENKRIVGMIDGIQAMKQAIFKILNTERYLHLIYSWDYGVEFIELIGENKLLAYPEIKRRITEALMQDDRITGVDAFSFESSKSGVNVTFTVYTTEGDVEIGKGVNL